MALSAGAENVETAKAVNINFQIRFHLYDATIGPYFLSFKQK